MKSEKPEITTAVRVFEIIEIVSKANPHFGLTLAEISKELNISKSTVHRYLYTLERLGAVERNDRENYHLGWTILSLAGNYLNNLDLPNIADMYMRELSEETLETVHLAVPSGNDVVYIAKVNSPKSIQMISQIGSRMPMYCTSLGKSMLAYLPEERFSSVIESGLLPRTENTITSPEELESNLDNIREVGYAVDNIENEDGVRCLGAAIFNHSKQLVGAVSVSGPAHRITEEKIHEIGGLVRDTALKISRRMGFPE
jgi:DNA-binding IclR family transcriptional regulator